MEGKLRREGMYVYLRLTHGVVQQKPTQHWKAIILQLKKKRPTFLDYLADEILQM